MYYEGLVDGTIKGWRRDTKCRIAAKWLLFQLACLRKNVRHRQVQAKFFKIRVDWNQGLSKEGMGTQ